MVLICSSSDGSLFGGCHLIHEQQAPQEISKHDSSRSSWRFVSLKLGPDRTKKKHSALAERVFEYQVLGSRGQNLEGGNLN